MFDENLQNKIYKFYKSLRENGVATRIKEAIQYIASAFLPPQIQYFKYRMKYRKAAPYSYNIIQVPVDEINYLITPRFRELNRYCTYIRGGDWDIRKCRHNLMLTSHYHPVKKQKRCIYPIQRYGLFKSSKKHFIDNASWGETKFFNWMQSKNNPGLQKYKSKRFNEYDRLHKKIKMSGYKTQSELRSVDNKNKPYLLLSKLTPDDEILINIGRDGKMFLDDGRHRFIIAKLLSVEYVPARVLVRHKYWQSKREIIANGEMRGLAPKFRNHPDIRNMI